MSFEFRITFLRLLVLFLVMAYGFVGPWRKRKRRKANG